MAATITLFPDGDNWRYRVQAPDPVTGMTVEVRSGNSFESKEVARTEAEQTATQILDDATKVERYDFPVSDEPPTS